MATATLRAVGRYRLESRIGRGGIAEVYRAVDSRLDRAVAVKMILPGLAPPAVLARFLRDTRAVAALEHPNILPVYDSGEEDGLPYLVMPLMTGGTLAERIGRAEVPAELAADWVTQLGDALDTAHAAGILHRDVKPGNVLMDRKDRPVLADFGLASTPCFPAPELLQGGAASPSSDLYALGVLAYRMLTGTTPFHGALPAPLDAFFARALANAPEERFESGAALARALRLGLGLATPETAAARAIAPAARPSDGDAASSGASGHAWTVAFVVVFAALGILLGARGLLGRSAHTATATARATTPVDAPIARLVDWIVDVDAPAEWQIALRRGDARASALVEGRLAEEPGDVRARLARAVLLHVEGRHAEAEAAAFALTTMLGDSAVADPLLRFVEHERAERERSPRP